MLGLKEEFGEDFLNYQISDFGRNISGGQAQRCSLLKIISNIKPILILDEPSSALDFNTSMIFNELLLSKTKNSILIVITHSKYQSDLFSSKFNL
jgi:ABC-type bacteriocin/lantibiotic exporter with double-glycine peptidase domain